MRKIRFYVTKIKVTFLTFLLSCLLISNIVYATENRLTQNEEKNIVENNTREETNNTIDNLNESEELQTNIKDKYTSELNNVLKGNIVEEDIQENTVDNKTQTQSTKQAKVHPNGIYNLAIGKKSSLSIEVLRGDEYDGATVDIYDYVGNPQQKFYLEYQEEGFYKITAMHTGKSLTIKNEQIKEGTEIVQSEYKGLASQKWILRDSNKNGWIISPLGNSELALSIQGKIEKGSKIILSKTKDNDNQMLYMFNISKQEKKHPNGIYNLAIGKKSSLSIEILRGDKFDGATVDIYDYVGNPQQKFYLEYQEEGFYKITAMHTGKSITIKDGQIKEGTEIVQSEYKGLASQKWILRDSNKNGWIISPLSKPCLALTIQKTIQKESKIIISKTKDNDNQMLYMFNISKQERKHSNGTYYLAVGNKPSLSMEVLNGDKFDGATLDIYDYEGKPQQKFYLEYQNEGFYKITAKHTGKSITIKDGQIKEGTEIVQSEYKGLASQKWILRDSNKNGWIISPLSNPCLALTIQKTIQKGSKIILSKTEDNDNQMFYIFKEVDLGIEEWLYGKSGLMYKGNGGQYLKYYKIGKGKKHLFLAFGIHGFEDSFYRDGQELTYLANEFFARIKKEMQSDLAEKWSIYILPCLNPDGEYNGWTNDGPGRTTLYSWAANNKGIDMNRCFPVGYKSSKNERNYNGEQPLQAFEAEALRDFILKYKGNENIVIDIHGWLDETMGDDGIGKYYRNEFDIQKHISAYGNGYFINWARSVPNTRSMLLELPEVKSHSELVNRQYVDKFYKATLNLLRNL